MPKIRQQSNTAEALKHELQSITSKRLAAGQRVKALKTLGEKSRWKPGQSGNPGGKPRVLKEILQLGYSNAVAMTERLIDAALHHEDMSVAVACYREVMNRTFGKPSEYVEAKVEHSFVLRAPTVLDSADEWEAKYGGPGPVIEGAATELPPPVASNEPVAPGKPAAEP